MVSVQISAGDRQTQTYRLLKATKLLVTKLLITLYVVPYLSLILMHVTLLKFRFNEKETKAAKCQIKMILQNHERIDPVLHSVRYVCKFMYVSVNNGGN